MSSISSITKAVSGLVSAQKGLQITGHNISNTNTEGYTRQQLLQSDSKYLTVGNNGGYSMQVGLGVTCDEIRQIRDELADKRLRTEKSVLSYYQCLNATSQDIESMFDEPYGNTISDFLNDFWSQAQKLSTTPEGVEERMSFISTAKVLCSKVNDVTEGLRDYQYKLNDNVKTSVDRINEITKEITSLNELIGLSEINGDNANDYRDTRNLLLDELASYGSVTYYEEPNHMLQVSFEGYSVIDKKIRVEMKINDIEGSPFGMPVWADTNSEVVDLNNISSSIQGNDSGHLKALLVARGNNVVNGDTTWDDIALNDHFSVDESGNAYVIPKIQKMLNEFTNTLVTTMNDAFNGTGIGDYIGVDGVPIFVPINEDTQLKANLVAAENAYEQAVSSGNQTQQDAALANLQEAKEKYNATLLPGNIQVNPLLLESGGYNRLGTVAKAADGSLSNAENTGDNTVVKNFLTEWGTTRQWFTDSSNTSPYSKTVTMSTFFSELVTEMGSDGANYIAKANEKAINVNNIENERAAMGGVSTDEEFTSMLKYQYAYNASARMITMLDSMLDTIINRM